MLSIHNTDRLLASIVVAMELHVAGGAALSVSLVTVSAVLAVSKVLDVSRVV